MTSTLALRYLSRILTTIALAATIYRLVCSWSEITLALEIDDFQKTALLCRQFSDIGLAMMAVFVSFKGSLNKGTQLFSLFIAGLVLADSWFFQLLGAGAGMALLSLVTALTATLFVLTFQHFPSTTTDGQIKQYIRFTPLRWVMIMLQKGKNMWFLFFPLIFTLSVTCNLLSLKPVMTVVNILIMLSGFAYMYISYKKVGIDSRNSILWLFWGLLCYVILIFFSAIPLLFSSKENTLIDSMVAIIGNLILLVMIFMSVFFARTFDTGFIIKRTIVDGSLFLLVILVYNVVEHYVLHTINHTLHINDAFLASLLSGIMVLVISPLHHKLTAYLNKKFKSGKDQHKH